MNQSIIEQIKRGMALAFFASAYADQAEECGQPLSGEIIDQLPDEIDRAATHAMNTLVISMLLKNGVNDLERFYTVLIQGCDPEGADRELEPELFGHYCAMQAMGHGVGLERFGYQMRDIITVPYIEFGSHSLQKDYFTAGIKTVVYTLPNHLACALINNDSSNLSDDEEDYLNDWVAEKVKEHGGKPSDYTKLFTAHSTCQVEKRKAEAVALMRRLNNPAVQP